MAMTSGYEVTISVEEYTDGFLGRPLSAPRWRMRCLVQETGVEIVHDFATREEAEQDAAEHRDLFAPRDADG